MNTGFEPWILIAAAAVLVVAAVIILGVVFTKRLNSDRPSESDIAGRRGEELAMNAIVRVLREGDRLFTNVPVEYEGKVTELDNVIVNENGVFIIEVKNYSGRLEGSVNDFEWKKFHRSKGGKTYMKIVKNPIRQVKRQIFLLSHYFKSQGLNVWISGYVLLLEDNAPVKSDMILSNADAIDRAIHRKTPKAPDLRTTRLVSHLLSGREIPKE
ncbi:MAG: NERD domain-containing protein [Clostridia bacterium]|nr:NERD domain-containing protein [Clostridia bacterium]